MKIEEEKKGDGDDSSYNNSKNFKIEKAIENLEKKANSSLQIGAITATLMKATGGSLKLSLIIFYLISLL